MAYNFKNLADVELLSAMPEEANVVVEVNGTTKRAPQVKVEGAGGSGGAFVVNLTWDVANPKDIADKTFEEVASAIREGQLVFARSYETYGDGEEYATQYAMTEYDGELGYIFFTETHSMGSSFRMNQVVMRADGTIENSTNTMNWPTT